VATVQVIQGPDKGKTFELIEGESTVGRKNCAVELSDGTISRSHCKLSTKNGKWMLEDLGSANGTFLNGVRVVKPSMVKRGDHIRCGSTLLAFGGKKQKLPELDVDEDGRLVDAAIVATAPSNEDSIIIPTPEAGAKAIERLRILYDLITEMGSIFDVDVLLQHTLDRCVDLLNADRGYVLLINQSGRLAPRASHLPKGSKDNRIPLSRTILDEVTSKEIGILSSNAMTDKRFASGKSVHDYGIRSAICVPIRGRERILGAIGIDCSVGDQTFSMEDLSLMIAVGYQGGLAVENVWMHESAVQSERLAAVGETVAFLSHHIKNILQALQGGMDLVTEGLTRQDAGRAQEAWPIVERNVGRINELIINMLTFSKEREPLLEQANISDVVTDVVQLVSPRADDRGVAILTDLEEMPLMPIDAAGLQQAFLNLLNNALDAVPDETGVITISTRYDPENRFAFIKFLDNGSGIAEKELDSIFNPFFSAKGHRGTGLGLAVTRKIIQEHHGQIRVSSKTDRGTAFTVVIPTLRQEQAGAKEDTQTPLPDADSTFVLGQADPTEQGQD